MVTGLTADPNVWTVTKLPAKSPSPAWAPPTGFVEIWPSTTFFAIASLCSDMSKNKAVPAPAIVLPLLNIIPVSKSAVAPATALVPLPDPNNMNLSSTWRFVVLIVVVDPFTV